MDARMSRKRSQFFLGLLAILSSLLICLLSGCFNHVPEPWPSKDWVEEYSRLTTELKIKKVKAEGYVAAIKETLGGYIRQVRCRTEYIEIQSEYSGLVERMVTQVKFNKSDIPPNAFRDATLESNFKAFQVCAKEYLEAFRPKLTQASLNFGLVEQGVRETTTLIGAVVELAKLVWNIFSGSNPEDVMQRKELKDDVVKSLRDLEWKQWEEVGTHKMALSP